MEENKPPKIATLKDPTNKVIVLAAGCFWGVQHKLDNLVGIKITYVGYTGGKTLNPNYESVCYENTGHAEAVWVEYNPEELSLNKILKLFFEIHDPTTKDRQGPDIGSQYRSHIFTTSEEDKTEVDSFIQDLVQQKKFKEPITTLVETLNMFYCAEEYHQKYIEKKRQ